MNSYSLRRPRAVTVEPISTTFDNDHTRHKWGDELIMDSAPIPPKLDRRLPSEVKNNICPFCKKGIASAYTNDGGSELICGHCRTVYNNVRWKPLTLSRS